MSVRAPIQGFPVPESDIVFLSSTSVTWTALPLAVTEFLGAAIRRRTRNLMPYNKFRFELGRGGTTGAVGSVLGMQFSPDGAANWYGLDNGTLNANSTVTIPCEVASVYSAPATLGTIHANARIASCLLRTVGAGGDGAISPGFQEFIMVVS